MLTEHAPAKINLTLRILGRRPDGYHELSSLVAFAACGDILTVTPGPTFELISVGPYAPVITGDNLVARTVARAMAMEPRLVSGSFTLAKNLPVAAGLGGGSSDAAATIRLLRRLNPDMMKAIDWLGLARELGADVPVCLHARAAHMAGIGERISPLAALPAVWVVLVNPGLPVSTAAVFEALAAEPFEGQAQPSVPTGFSDLRPLIAYLEPRQNDLEPPAIQLCPDISRVLAALTRTPGVLLSRMSGSGPTCLGLFATRHEASAARTRLVREHPDWWIGAAELT